MLDFGASDYGVRFLAMERLVGIDLDRLVREGGPMPLAMGAVHLARQAGSFPGRGPPRGHRSPRREALQPLPGAWASGATTPR
ncbi:MAG: hypothetical protein IPF99_28860 [Deltaproteobacteria bacterium]|nr:hypothetical protein [Deltaproteobacteria bacterium]